MGTAIDKKILSKLNKFDEVDRLEITPERDPVLDKKCFEAPLQKRYLPKSVQQIGLNDIVGTGDATWHSPAAENINKPFAQMLAARLCHGEGNLLNLEFAWLSRVCNNQMLIRRKTAFKWFLVVGDLFGSFLSLWPVKRRDVFFELVLDETAEAENVAITDVDAWEARPILPISPQHVAIKIAQGPDAKPDAYVKLQHSNAYPDVPLVAEAIDKTRPLLECFCRSGCGDAEPPFLLELCGHLGLVPEGNDLFDLITVLCRKAISKTELTDELLAEIYMKRQVTQEPNADVADLLDLEYIMEAFDEYDKKALEPELKSAKATTNASKQFRTRYVAWKVS